MSSLEQSYIELQPKLYTFFVMKTSNAQAAEDLTQDVFYEASKSIHSFKGDSHINTWLFSIAKNLLSKYYRRRKYEQNLSEKLMENDEPIRQHSIEHSYELKEELAKLQQHIYSFDETTRDIILLRLYGELSFADIGMLVGKSENFARVTFFRAKQKLMKEMEGRK